MEKSILYSIFAVNLDGINIGHKRAYKNQALFLGIHFKHFMPKL
jgi:hypothetical protein